MNFIFITRSALRKEIERIMQQQIQTIKAQVAQIEAADIAMRARIDAKLSDFGKQVGDLQQQLAAHSATSDDADLQSISDGLKTVSDDIAQFHADFVAPAPAPAPEPAPAPAPPPAASPGT